MRKPPPPDLDRVYVLTDGGLRQLMGGDTTLADSALRLLVLVDGKLSLAKLAKHLQGVVEPELSDIASALILAGHIKPISADTVKLADDLGALDFFSTLSEEEGAPAEAKERDFAKALEEARDRSGDRREL